MEDIDVGGDELNTNDLGPIFPLSRVKKIMKTDKDVHMCSADAVVFTALAAERFLEFFSDNICRRAEKDKRKTIAYKDAANTVKDDPRLAFLSPLIPQQLPLPKAIELKQKVVTSLKQDIATDEETLLDANSSSAHLQIPQ